MPLDLNALMQQAQQLQEQMQKTQERLAQKIVTGSAGGGMVLVTANGKGEIQKVQIDKQAVDPRDVPMLEDLVLAAVNGALRAAQEAQAEEVHAVKALSLGGGKRENDLGLELLVTPTTSEMLLFHHSESGFGFTLAGTLKDFNTLRECATGGEDSSGWTSWVRSEQDHLAVLRIDGTCSGGAWQASCVLYRFDQGALARSGTCNLPSKLEAKALKASGWK